MKRCPLRNRFPKCDRYSECKWFVEVDDPGVPNQCVIEIVAESLGRISRSLAEDSHIATVAGEETSKQFAVIESDRVNHAERLTILEVMVGALADAVRDRDEWNRRRGR